MSGFRRFFRVVGLTVAAALFVTSLPLGAARAGLVTTERVIEETQAQADRERLIALFEREDVRQQLETLGVNHEEATARLASLSDAEVQEIAGRLDELPAGQDFLTTFFVIIGVAVVAVIVLDLLGVTDLLPFIRPVR